LGVPSDQARSYLHRAEPSGTVRLRGEGPRERTQRNRMTRKKRRRYRCTYGGGAFGGGIAALGGGVLGGGIAALGGGVLGGGIAALGGGAFGGGIAAFRGGAPT